MTDLATVETSVKTDAATLESELGFVKAHWTSLSAVLIVVFALGVAAGWFLHRL